VAAEKAAARKWDEAQAAEAKERAASEAAYAKTSGGKIWTKHRDWSRETCDTVAKGKFKKTIANAQNGNGP